MFLGKGAHLVENELVGLREEGTRLLTVQVEPLIYTLAKVANVVSAPNHDVLLIVHAKTLPPHTRELSTLEVTRTQTKNNVLGTDAHFGFVGNVQLAQPRTKWQLPPAFDVFALALGFVGKVVFGYKGRYFLLF